MQYSFIKKITSILIIVFLSGISGCAMMTQVLPAPPGIFVKIELNGPYDVDLPSKYVRQLKNASIVSNQAIPYIFIQAGMHFVSVGDETRAFYFFDRAITEFRKRKDITGEGTVINCKIFALYEFGKMQDAFNVIRETEKNWPDAPLNAFVSYNYGHYYLLKGDYNKALDYFRQVLQSSANVRDDINILMLKRDSELEYGMTIIWAQYFSAVSKKIGLMDFEDIFFKTIGKNIDESIDHLQQVIALNKTIKKTKMGGFTSDVVFQTTESKACSFLGLAYGIKGKFPDALENLDTSIKLARKADNNIAEADSIFFRNHVYLMEKNKKDGQEAARQLQKIAEKYHLPFYQIWAKFILSRYYYSGYGDISQAIASLKDAVNLMEKQYSDMVIDSPKNTYMFSRQVLYESLIELLVKEGNYSGALETAERSKSAALVDLLASKDIGKTPAESELIRQSNNNIKEMAEGYKKLLTTTGDNAAAKMAIGKIAKAEKSQRDLLSKIKEQNEELYSLMAVEQTNCEDIRQLLDKNTTLFSYYLANNVLYVWALNKERIHLEKIRISKEEVSQLVWAFNAAIAARDINKYESLSQKVYNTFLKPVIPFVSGDRIGFIPHDALYYLPFAAMTYEKQYLVDGFSIFYLPGAGALKYVMKKQPAKSFNVLAFGNPDLGNKKLDLPFAEAEVESIRKIIPQTSVFLRAEATEKKAKEMSGRYDIVHFAVHGLYAGDAPVNSGLLLAAGGQNDGRLTVSEIIKLRFKGRLVVISGSKVVPNSSSNGMEIMGFNSAFLYAGSPSVLTTLWNVEDNSTAVFMDIFYKTMQKNESIADSLKETQSEMIKLGYEPYHWAAFILNGKY